MTASAKTENPCAPSGDPLSRPPLDLLRGAALFLDFDGTLVDIQPRPDAVSVDDQLHALIATLADRLDGRVAIVSGRSIAQLDSLFGGLTLATSGSHGAELRGAGGEGEVPDRPGSLDTIAATIQRFADANPGAEVEVKSFGIGLHYRGAPHIRDAADALTRELADAAKLSRQEGKMVFEVRVPGDKGAAIARFLDDTPFAGARPVFVGDDLTDEPGFAAVAARGGAGILVGPPRDTAATYRLNDVVEVLEWLAQAAEAA